MANRSIKVGNVTFSLSDDSKYGVTINDKDKVFAVPNIDLCDIGITIELLNSCIYKQGDRQVQTFINEDKEAPVNGDDSMYLELIASELGVEAVVTKIEKDSSGKRQFTVVYKTCIDSWELIALLEVLKKWIVIANEKISS